MCRQCSKAAQAKGLTTAAVGKFGDAFIQDCHRGSIILDENAAIQLSFAKDLQNAGYPLPKHTVNAYSTGALVLAGNNGDPTAPIPIQRLNGRETADPLDRTGALSRRGLTYLTDVFLNYILPTKKPDLTIFWSKEITTGTGAGGPPPPAPPSLISCHVVGCLVRWFSMVFKPLAGDWPWSPFSQVRIGMRRASSWAAVLGNRTVRISGHRHVGVMSVNRCSISPCRRRISCQGSHNDRVSIGGLPVTVDEPSSACPPGTGCKSGTRPPPLLRIVESVHVPFGVDEDLERPARPLVDLPTRPDPDRLGLATFALEVS